MQAFETERLRLRLFEPADAAALEQLYSDPEVMRFLPTKKSRPDGAAQVELFRERYETLGYTLWAAERRENRDFVGRIGLWPLEDSGEVELAYVVAKRHWGQGYATEAAAACLQFGFARCELPFIAAIAAPGNGASLRVMEKLGFTFLREDRFYETAVRYHRLTRQEWERQESG